LSYCLFWLIWFKQISRGEKIEKKKKKWLKMFRLRRAPHHYNKFHLGKKYKSRRGGGKK